MPIAQLDRASVSGTDYSGSTPDRHTLLIKLKLVTIKIYILSYTFEIFNFEYPFHFRTLQPKIFFGSLQIINFSLVRYIQEQAKIKNKICRRIVF